MRASIVDLINTATNEKVDVLDVSLGVEISDKVNNFDQQYLFLILPIVVRML